MEVYYLSVVGASAIAKGYDGAYSSRSICSNWRPIKREMSFTSKQSVSECKLSLLH